MTLPHRGPICLIVVAALLVGCAPAVPVVEAPDGTLSVTTQQQDDAFGLLVAQTNAMDAAIDYCVARHQRYVTLTRNVQAIGGMVDFVEHFRCVSRPS